MSLPEALINAKVIQAKSWLIEATESRDSGLGYCRNCGHEYTNDQRILHTDKFLPQIGSYFECPKCGCEDDRNFYMCQNCPADLPHITENCPKEG